MRNVQLEVDAYTQPPGETKASKVHAAERAVEFVQPGMVVGLAVGSMAYCASGDRRSLVFCDCR